MRERDIYIYIEREKEREREEEKREAQSILTPINYFLRGMFWSSLLVCLSQPMQWLNDKTWLI